ncbi:MAG: hypothetical protein M5R41_10540 [Bacteroidia bacterium]|nr:hypothetical protein [Bacteroidia bacterium]
MKKILSLATVFALTFALSAVNAQEQPKAESKVKSGCCASSSSKAKQMSDCSSEAKAKKASNKAECEDKAVETTKTAQKASNKTESSNKN